MFSQDLSSGLTLLLISCVALAPLKSIELTGVQSGTTPTEDGIKTIKHLLFDQQGKLLQHCCSWQNNGYISSMRVF